MRLSDEALIDLLQSPLNGRRLVRVHHNVLSDGDHEWPFIAGIPYLRTTRLDIASSVVELTKKGKIAKALAKLLADRKDDTVPKGDLKTIQTYLASSRSPLPEAMDSIGYSHTAHYFVHRTTLPSYLSGLTLLENHAPLHGALFEVGSGLGHYLREWTHESGPAIGSDRIFSHLWLAQAYVAPLARFVCFDANKTFPIRSGSADLVLAQDSFHYLPDKETALGEMLRIAGESILLIGHVHNSKYENYSPGTPLTSQQYIDLIAPSCTYDDAALTHTAVIPSPRVPPPGNADTQAIAFVRGSSSEHPRPGRFTTPSHKMPLRVNPLLKNGQPEWPTNKFQDEFVREWPYLQELKAPPGSISKQIARGGNTKDPTLAALARRRVLIEAPNAWIGRSVDQQ